MLLVVKDRGGGSVMNPPRNTERSLLRCAERLLGRLLDGIRTYYDLSTQIIGQSTKSFVQTLLIMRLRVVPVIIFSEICPKYMDFFKNVKYYALLASNERKLKFLSSKSP